ncbi:importin subunit alpha-4/3 [Nematocida ausubeli]|uniref:Importin subunit alpha n=1 Tax=Nematocida ausubeli (strain ATCC PRA-371 / ERTm2) TaxID=1913371 RepID=A0A086J1K0_NEMA1|nr:uncharacterized protein NESG_01130 [Nematocida ausubeli]KAI5132503.1 importin subunit alpha-4/3 [Nematocida ausubeli]KAI5137786.1 importin subunit alpha-4/3 [Nematocida ausubeli]KAI5147042.1 importin subunit alpha-4/3 [Nematocida ausubeli]KAI5161321.1 importin subunit alpha-4/3 [Nematocida ausubeli]KFG26018.1 hypothetical protein NESG_01130 [Nematocida ausubeli]
MDHGYKNSGRGARSERETRTSNAIELRTQKRDGMLQKKRSLISAGEESTSKINILVEQVNSKDPNDIIKGVTEFRRLLSAAKCPPIDTVVMNGLTPIFSKLINPDNPIYTTMPEDLAVRIMHESAWVITNIASGNTTQTMAAVKAGALPNLVKMMYIDNLMLQDQAIWGISNIAGDCEVARDFAISANAADPMVYIINKEMEKEELNIPLLRNLAWALSNMNRGRNPPPYISHTEKCLPAIIKLVGIDDTDIMVDAYWALSYMCDAGKNHADMVISTGIVADCAARLSAYYTAAIQGDTMQLHMKEQTLSPIIRILGNIATYEDEQTDYVLGLGILSTLKGLFALPFENRKAARVKKEICWLISNITAGTPEQVDEVIKHGFLEVLVNAMKTADNLVRTEACWAICNATIQVGEGTDHSKEIGEAGAIIAFSKFLPSVMNDTKLVSVILDAVKSLLSWAECESVGGDNIIAAQIESCDLLEYIEELQAATNYSIASKAEDIIRSYFEGH